MMLLLYALGLESSTPRIVCRFFVGVSIRYEHVWTPDLLDVAQ